MEYRGNKIFSNCADEYFGNDFYTNFYNDATALHATARYVSLKHLVAEESILKCVVNNRRSSNDAGEDYINNIEPNTIYIYVNRNKDDVVCKIEKEGWVALDKDPYPVSSFLSNPLGVVANAYANIEQKTAIIFVSRYSSTWQDLLAQVLFKVLLWIYPENVKDIDPNEFALYEAIHKNDSDKFTQFIDAQYIASDIESLWVKKQLFGWANIGIATRIDQCKQNMSSYSRNIEDYERRIKDLLNDYARANQELTALNGAQRADDNMFWDYFTKHKQLEFVKVSTNNGYKNLIFCIRETLEYFDTGELKRMLDNQNSFLYEYANDETLTVLRAIFVEEKAKVRVRSCFKLTGTSSLQSYRSGTSLDYYSDSLKHPHLGEFDCLGANETYINQAMMKGDWEIAIEQCIAASKNIAFGDEPVMEKFIKHLNPNNASDKRCIVTNDGKDLTVREFYEAYISEQKEKETAETLSGETNE